MRTYDQQTSDMAAFCKAASPDQIIDAVRGGAALWLPHNSADACLHFNEFGCAFAVHWGQAKCASRALPITKTIDGRDGGYLFA